MKSPYSMEGEREKRFARTLKIVERYMAGVDITDIQSEFECSKTTVLRIARAFNLQPRPKRSHDPAVRATVIDMLQAGDKYSKIAATCRVSQAYISLVAKELGLSRYRSAKDHRRPDGTA